MVLEIQSGNDMSASGKPAEKQQKMKQKQKQKPTEGNQQETGWGGL
jgi:hypothetical protein